MCEINSEMLTKFQNEYMLRKGIRDGGYWQNFVNLINKYGIVPEYVFPDTYSSSNTKELNELLSKYLRKFTIEIRKNKNNINEIKEKTLQDVYNILCNCQGVSPNRFDFEQHHDIINYPSPNKPFNKMYTEKHLYNVLVGYKEDLFLNLNYNWIEEHK